MAADKPKARTQRPDPRDAALLYLEAREILDAAIATGNFAVARKALANLENVYPLVKGKQP